MTRPGPTRLETDQRTDTASAGNEDVSRAAQGETAGDPAATEVSLQPASIDPFSTFVPAASREAHQRPCYDALVRGDQIGDFRIQRLLGRGSFGAVYLARELTLDRLVAVKVVLPEGQNATAGEGRNLARLRHANIVGVYGEAMDAASGCSLLWMQYVDGSNLASLISSLHAQPRLTGETAVPDRPAEASVGQSDAADKPVPQEWTEADLLALLAVDDATRAKLLEGRSPPGSIETVCRLGWQLAEALAHAHASGIAHRDIKPANILVQRDGTPMLADFNMADQEVPEDEGAHGRGKQKAGGTIAYMPPEQLAHALGEGPEFDTRRADLYALGMVLWELMYGRRPYAAQEDMLTSNGVQRLRDLVQVRRQPVPPSSPGIRIGLDLVLRRALDPEPQRRFPSARAFATALKGLEELQRARRLAPSLPQLYPIIRHNLFWVILVAGVLPHLAASVLQSLYNQLWIETDTQAFGRAFIAYNVVVYPACVGWLAWKLVLFGRGYRRVIAREPLGRGELRKLRGRLLKLPRQFTIASAIGWFPGILLFPWLLGFFGASPTTEDQMHYGISFAVAGLIATTYSYALVVYLVGVHGYRACWQTATHYCQRARYELRGMETRIGRVSVLVGTLPLAAAVLLLLLTPPEPDKIAGLHQLVIALIVSGGIGLYLVVIGSARLIRVVRALTLHSD